MSSFPWGWVVIDFLDPDSDNTEIWGMKISTRKSHWRDFAKTDNFDEAMVLFREDLDITADTYKHEGDVLSIRVYDLPKDEWELARSWWSTYMGTWMTFTQETWEEMPHDQGIRPHLTPDDQIRADELEELLDPIL